MDNGNHQGDSFMIRHHFAAMATALGLSLAATGASAQNVTIKYSNWMPATYHAWVDVIQPWFKDIEKVTEGRVKVDILPKVVGSVAAQVDVVRDGLADMAWITVAFTPGRYHATEVAELPLLSSSSTVHAPAYEKMYRTRLKPLNEFKGVELMVIFPITPAQVFTKKTPVRSLADMAGLKFRSPTTTTTDTMNILKAIPINKTPTEAYEMLSAGTLDGQITQINTVVGFNQKELTDHLYMLPGGISAPVVGIAINPDVWAKISKKDQDAIMGVSAEALAAKFGKRWDQADTEGMEVLKQSGYKITEATAEQAAQFRAAVKPLEQRWIDKAKTLNIPNPEGILADYKKAVGTK